MYKLVIFCTLTVCALSAPTEKTKDDNSTESIIQEKPLPENHQVFSGVSIKSPSTTSTEKRDKREDLPSSSADNKRTATLSQPDYQENKPPTFVHPVPVDQIIRNSDASPQIHSSKHVEHVEEVEEKGNVETENEGVSEEEVTEVHRSTYKKHPSIKSKTSDDKSRESN